MSGTDWDRKLLLKLKTPIEMTFLAALPVGPLLQERKQMSNSRGTT